MINIPLWTKLATIIVVLGTMFRAFTNSDKINDTNLRLKNLESDLRSIEDALRLLELDFKKLGGLETDVIDALHTSKTAHKLIEREAVQLKDIESKFKELRGEIAIANNRSMSALDMIKTIGKGTKKNTDEINKLKGNEPVVK